MSMPSKRPASILTNRPQTWDELVAAGVKLTRDTDGDGKADKWGIVSHTTVNGFL